MGDAESLGDLRYGMMRLVESLGSETRQEFRPWMMGTPKVLATCATGSCGWSKVLVARLAKSFGPGWGMAESLGDLRNGMMRLVESLGSETRQEFRPWMVGMAESLGDLRYGMMRLVESLGSETRQEFRPWMMGDAESLGDLRYGTMRLVESLGSETRQEFRPCGMCQRH
ncbi:hypothetical protein K227x_25900 [Rubripirellula lacrimiformis]|uniref:Uncharacterized protein n=2 Tax=Rubripirellula lacrimiformis TaxID=1930273 RepID=A0A517NAP0_9BACT|nr:hypothetical protein K227x_25900 [Rubripirellula lacrimiformis]